MNNIALELIFWVTLSFVYFDSIRVFKKQKGQKKGYSRKISKKIVFSRSE